MPTRRAPFVQGPRRSSAVRGVSGVAGVDLPARPAEGAGRARDDLGCAWGSYDLAVLVVLDPLPGGHVLPLRPERGRRERTLGNAGHARDPVEAGLRHDVVAIQVVG